MRIRGYRLRSVYYEALELRTIKLKWNKEEFDVTIEEGTNVEAATEFFRGISIGQVFKTQVWTLTQVPVERQRPVFTYLDDKITTTQKV